MKSKTLCLYLIFLCILLLIQSPIFAQFNPNCRNGQDQVTGELCQNPIKVGVFFMNYPSDARSISMGGVGIATKPGFASVTMNSSNLAFIDTKFGIAQSYGPFLTRDIISDLSLSNLAVYYKINNSNVLAGSFNYLTSGIINFQDHNGNEDSKHLFELEGLISYNQKLTKQLAVGISVKYIYASIDSKMANILSLPQNEPLLKPGQTIAIDLSCTYQKPLKLGTKNGEWISGFAISNIGTKLHYLTTTNTFKSSEFLPTNLGIGTGLTMELAKEHSFTISVDINRLLVPTPSSVNVEGDPLIFDFEEKNFWQGMVGSFTDAPNGFAEEWNENQYSFGLEYHYKAFYVRHGYYLQHVTKGNGQFMANGLGVKAFGIGLDFSYIFSLNQGRLPESYRMTLSYDFGTNNTK